MAEQKTNQAREAERDLPGTWVEGTDGVQRLAAAPDDESPDKDARTPGPVVPVSAPQNYDDVTATFSEGKVDPNAGAADAVNAVQSRATVGHAVKAGGEQVGEASGEQAAPAARQKDS
jgi:hypothetical protein